MKTILAIETSCDETAISIIKMDEPTMTGRILSHIVHTQIDIHAEYGGVYPMLAKRDHILNCIPVLDQALKKSGLYQKRESALELDEKIISIVRDEICKHEDTLASQIIEYIKNTDVPNIDYIALKNEHLLNKNNPLYTLIDFKQAQSIAVKDNYQTWILLTLSLWMQQNLT